ncbi:unnamed protein product [Adineta steineri]|uniref:RING-type E3 ubiquitin transferase n=1 Tax=Adineta steineri TaxID=433720 RepID=A0A819CJZ4_9BILA|nr:unnamed protein product [Adineta steineri]
MAEDKVRVQTSDGETLEVDYAIAKQWAPIKNMYEVFGTLDTKDRPVELSNVNTDTLKKIISWADHYKQSSEDADGDDEPKPKRTVDLSDFDKKYFEVKQEMLFEIIMASNYLGMTVLLDKACKTVADMIKDKTPDEVRKTFNIPNDLPPLEITVQLNIFLLINMNDDDLNRNAPEIINLDESIQDETSNTRRRRSSSTSSQEIETLPRPITASNKRKKTNANDIDDDNDDKEDISRTIIQNDAEVCPICLEEWTNSGLHRLVATECGHLFGKICIEKWLKTSPKCPQCQSTVKKKELRRIFCRALQVLDTSERDNAIRERDLEKKARKKLAYEKAELQLAYDIIKDQLKRLQNEHDRLLRLTQGLTNLGDTMDDSSRPSADITTINLAPPLPSFNMRLETVIKIPEGMCRVLAYAPSHQWLFVSQPTNNSLYPGYGIKKISLIDGGRALDYTTLRHTKPIRDIQLHGDLLLSCAWDKTMRIFDYTRNTFNLLCECASQVWSCAWNLDDPNIIYAGLNNGRVQVFDRRQIQTGETTLSSSIETLSLSTASPIVSLQYIQRNTNFQSSGLLVGSNDKSGFYEHIPNSEYRYHALPIDKHLSSLHYDSTTNRLLASFRPQSSPARHELYELITRPIEDSEQSFIVSLQLIQTFIGSSINIVLSRSKILHKNFETYIVASDNGSHGIELWNIRQPSETPSFKVPTQCDIVDVCLTRQHLCALADNQVRLYKWT